MFRIVCLVAALAGAAAFQAPIRHAGRTHSVAMQAEMSKSLPFLKRPEKLDGSMVGDVGFDPMGLSEQGDLTYMRAAEIKHGRVAMLATVGWLAIQFIHIPGLAGTTTQNPLEALKMIPVAGHAQIFLLIAILELKDIDYTYNSDTPWDLGWGSSRLDKLSSDAADTMRLKELKNGRLAMIAISGMFVQTSLFGKLF